MRFPLALFLVLITLSTCGQDKSPEIQVQEEGDQPFENLPLSEIMEFKSIIPLETTGNSVIGNISEVQIADDKIFILDSRPKSILVFDLEGSFIKRIGSPGNGPGEYNYITDFDILEGELSLIDMVLKKIITYDLNGNLIQDLKLPSGLNCMKLAKIDNGDFLVQLLPPPGSSGYALAQINRKGEVVDKYLRSTSVHFRWNLSNSNEFFRASDGSIRFIPGYGKVIYTYHNGKIEPFIEVNPSEEVMSHEQFKKVAADIMNMHNLMRGMWGMQFYNENKEYINFSYHLSSNGSRSVFIKKENGALIQETVFFVDDYFNTKMMALRPVYSNDSVNVFKFNTNEVVNTIQAFVNSDIVQSVGKRSSDVVQKRIASLSTESNPVLVVYEVK